MQTFRFTKNITLKLYTPDLHVKFKPGDLPTEIILSLLIYSASSKTAKATANSLV